MSNPGDTELVTMEVAGQSFGIPVAQVRDVLGPQAITCIPLAPAAVSGSLNLRGRIVTVLDMRVALGLGRTEDPAKSMNVVTDRDGELYSLLVDQVGDVLTVAATAIEPTPSALAPAWRDVSAGIVQMKGQLLLVLILDRLLPAITMDGAAAAA